jgi:thiamine kinase-like enzyme
VAPDLPWLSRDWLRAYAGSRPVPEPVPWDHPLIAEGWPAPLRAGLAAVWDARDELFALADGLPRTLCHHDVWPANVIWGPAGLVLLDWSFVGPGAIGEDPANLIVDSLTDGHVPVSRLDEVEAAVTAGYLAGLAETDLDPALVRRAIAITGAAKYCWFAPRASRLVDRWTPGGYDAADNPAEVVRRWRPICELLVRWTATALGRPVR